MPARRPPPGQDPPVTLAADTVLTRTAPGVHERHADRTWWGHESLFGGYGLALAASAIEAEAGEDGARTVRAITMHFLRPLLDGAVRVDVEVERAGRTVTTVTARLSCRERLCALAMATLAAERPSPALVDVQMPDVVPVGPDESPLEPRAVVPSHGHFDFFPRFSSGRMGDAGPMVTGGWIRTREPEPLGVGLLCAYGDIWVPAVYRRLESPVATMSSDFTAHIRVPFPRPDGAAIDASTTPLLCRLRTAAAREGFADEDCEIWSPDGTLLAHTRQLRVMQDLAL
jgi:acyl-CoA thioesterase